MGAPNETMLTEFILTGLSEYPRAQAVLFCFLLMAYLVSNLGNGLIIILIIADPQLHNPMYFFLCVLSLIDLLITNNTVPEVLANCFFYMPTISYYRCLIQMYVGMILFSTETILLAIMAYDRFAAICQPLHYMQIISWRFCINLVASTIALSFLITFITVLLQPTDFCGHYVINHFACEIQTFLKLTCSDTHTGEIFVHISSLFLLVPPFSFIVVTYGRIGWAVLHIRSAQGRKKAFSTCSSHLTVVSIFYGALMIMYLKPQQKSLSEGEKIVSVMYGAMTSMLNPVIYSLRNRDVKAAFWKVVGGKMSR
ncbi:olfactory receptor 13H1-like [Eublepharis macularius]|uniref:Olfactory receptor n=1 Tax=Eublepharis macularius TaxID=481883 RepID=A0AA97KQ64_EUBMA|nr:olfactory receptor 13H1-like [Eublepharis macularius]